MSNLKLSINERIQEAKSHGFLNTVVDQSLLRAWQCDTRDSRIAGLIEQRLHAFESALATGRIPPFKASHLHEGDLVLGKDLHGHWARIWLRSLLAGLLIVANTGSGKSNLLLSLITQVAALRCNFWMGEFYKRQLRHLRKLLARFGITLIVLRPQDWKWNLLQAHVNDPRMHLNLFVDLISRVCDLSIRSRNILSQGCYELYRRYGIWEGNKTAWPTIFELVQWVQTAPDLNALARDTIVSRLIALILDFSPRVLAYRRGWGPTDLASFNIDFEMSAASETVKKLLPSLLIFPVFQHEIEKGIVNGPPKLVLAFDDSQRLFETSLCSDGSIAPLDELAGVIRGAGLSLWVIVQSMGSLSPRLIPNLATKLFGRLGSHSDTTALGAELALSSEQVQWSRIHQDTGCFICQVSTGSWREPFAFAVPLINIEDQVDDIEVAESVKDLDVLPVEPAPEYFNWEPFPVVSINPAASSKPDAAQTNTPKSSSLSESELEFLRLVIAQPGMACNYYNKQLHLNGKRAAEMRKKLTEHGYLAEYEVATSARGRNSIVLEPLSPAFEAVGSTQEEAS